MIKIYNPNISSQEIGGGWTFKRNFEAALKDQAIFVDKLALADVLFISSLMIVDKNDVYNAKRAGKKILLRVDNMPRKSRNQRSTPSERMKEFAHLADHVIYQSKWAQDWIGSFLGVQGTVIYNSVNENVFYTKEKPTSDDKHYLVVQYNRDENKRIPEAFDLFTKAWQENPKSHLTIAGRFSPELVNAGFDFFRGEPIEYKGVIENPNRMADLMRSCDTLIYPTYSDACPNTVIEALMCGMDILHTGWIVLTEIMERWEKDGPSYFSLPRMAKEYLNLL